MQADIRATRVDQLSKILKFVWIGFYSAILSLFTLGIFSFWGRTQMRRQLWKDTQFEGEALEYTGKGSELFIGAILAGIVLSLGFGALFGIPAFVFGVDPGAGMVVAVISGIVFVIALILLPGLAIFLQRRYILSRTTLRGIRFEQSGNPFSFAGGAFVQSLLTLITLGIYAPIARLRIAAMFWTQAKFGDSFFSFDADPSARTEPVWKSFWLAYLGGFIFLAIFYGALFGYAMANGGTSPQPGDPDFVTFMVVVYGSFFGGALLYLFLAVWHEAVMLRQTVKLISLSGGRFTSDAKTLDLLFLALTNVLLMFVTLGFGAMAVQMRVWRYVARSTVFEGAIDYDNIEQNPNRGPATGEGLASQLDLGGAF
jgi:uncharacterized membrane protein YjgN (DUF898 family)